MYVFAAPIFKKFLRELRFRDYFVIRRNEVA